MVWYNFFYFYVYHRSVYIFERFQTSQQYQSKQMNQNISQSMVFDNNGMNTGNIGQEETFFRLIFFLKIIFYLVFAAKIIEISFLRRKKYSIKQRIYRKFLFSHQELLKNFTDEDKSIMDITINNTIKNASIEYDPNNSKIRRPHKRVSIHTEKNDYYDPKDWKQQQYLIYMLQKKSEKQENNAKIAFQQQKLEEQYVQKSDLLGLNQNQYELLPLSSNIHLKQEQKVVNQEIFSPNLVNNEII